MTAREAATISTLAGISSVRPVRTYDLDTFRGPKFIGADKIWDGSAVPGGIGTKGEGRQGRHHRYGTNAAHPELANDPVCGFSEANPKLHAVDCNTSSAGVCNGPTPDAQVSGHGVHTQTTVAGNTIDNSADPSPILPDGITMSGVAPCATVYSYRVESADGTLSGDAIEAAIESLAVDQIDVANYSIGVSCSNGTPWSDEDRTFLDSVNADVFIAASAGNTRAGAGTPTDPNCPNPVGGVAHMGPWMLTVAASTQDELFSPRFSVVGPTPVPANLQTIALVPGSNVHTTQVPAFNDYPLRDYPDNLAGCTDTGGFPANYFSGSIAVVRRGFNPPGTVGCSFVEKVNNAAEAGAQMVLIANNSAVSVNPLTDGTPIPSFMVEDLTTADALIAFVTANPRFRSRRRRHLRRWLRWRFIHGRRGGRLRAGRDFAGAAGRAGQLQRTRPDAGRLRRPDQAGYHPRPASTSTPAAAQPTAPTCSTAAPRCPARTWPVLPHWYALSIRIGRCRK